MALCVAALVQGCGPPPEESAGRFTTAATVALPPDTLDLAGNLRRLQSVISDARDAERDDMFALIREAERVTDRLLESEPPIAWLPEQYSVDATLRQFQAVADRVVARLRRGAGPEDVADDLAEFEASVAHMRQVLDEGTGTGAPADLDSLLRDSAAARRSPVEVFGGVRQPAPPPARADTSRPVLLGTEPDSTRL